MGKHWTRPCLEAQLMRGDWFRSLPVALRQELLSLGTLRQYSKGSLLLAPDLPPSLLVVLRGTVICSRISPSGQETIYHVGRPGFWFGMALILHEDEFEVTVTAQTSVLAMVIAGSSIASLAVDHPHYHASLARLSLTRLGRVLRLLEHAGSRNPSARIAARLYHLHHIDLEGDRALTNASVQISQALLAQMTDLSRPTVNRVLHELARVGIVGLGFRSIVILDVAALAALADLGHPAE